MAVRSRRMFGPTVVAAGATVQVFQCPAGRTAVFRSITLLTGSSVPGIHAWLGINNGGGLTNFFGHGLTAGEGEVVLDDVILNPGDTLHLNAVGGPITIAGFGSLLDGAPT